ncbi:DUF4030 domain-containing protein [Peribacillus frigoritolerans]|uniref:DUF4030 domain-containing protein n=1 Tax=Peribacillus frigoritolerans TaxID=450367 RepID=UPI00105A8A59|nr:DUF4030 domain-containing protein [Peribacillus frigoritolerans]TDL76136.1 DUF4030 domain-containing protein [Peribacillus frigoritolerans]
MDNKIRQEMNKIEIPMELNNRVILGMENAKKDYEKQLKPDSKGDRKIWSLRKKTMFFSSVAVLLLGLFISSAFVSPTMAKVISNIPYLEFIFQSQSVDSLIYDELLEKGYNITTGIRYEPEKIVEVSIEGSDDYYNEVKDDVEKIVNRVLISKGYDAYSVKVNKFVAKSDYVLNDKETIEKNQLESEVTKKLKQLDYKFDMVQVDPTEKTIFINIVGSKEYYNSIQDTIEKKAIEVANANKYKSYRINVTRVTVKVTKPDKGAQIIPVIAEGLLSKKEFKVTGVSYKSKPLSIMIKTSILSSDPTAKSLGTEIESMIVDFLTSEEISSILKNESYEIIVNSKDNKKIN